MAEPAERARAITTQHAGLHRVEDRVGLLAGQLAVADRGVESFLQRGSAVVAAFLVEALADRGQRVVDLVDREVELFGERRDERRAGLSEAFVDLSGASVSEAFWASAGTAIATATSATTPSSSMRPRDVLNRSIVSPLVSIRCAVDERGAASTWPAHTDECRSSSSDHAEKLMRST
jgi:hypothetical protein